MPNIELVNGSFNVLSGENTPALAHYLQAPLVFAFRADKFGLKGTPKTIGDLEDSDFPLSISPNAPGSSFAVSDVSLKIAGGATAVLDLLKDKKKSDFLTSMALENTTTPNLMAFGFGGNVQAGPTGTVGDFSFGMTTGQEITLTTFSPVNDHDGFEDAIHNTMSAVTIPHDLDDLRSLPDGHFCRLEGKGTLTFTASVQYKVLNNVLASEPLDFISETLSVNLQAGPKLTVTIKHSGSHQITVGSLGGKKIRLGASITTEADAEASIDFSVGITGEAGSTDGLAFILQQISPKPEEELIKIKQELPADRQSDLSSQIKKVLNDATKSGITATLHDAFEKSRETNHLFLYDVDLDALDVHGEDAIMQALRGDFTQLTNSTSPLAGITETKSFSTLTLTTKHTLTIHLLGILNFGDVSSFVQKSKVALNGDTGEIVLTSTDIKVIENNIDPDHLRKALLRSAMITTSAASSPKSPDFAFKMVFFLSKARSSVSDVRQFRNILAAVSSPDTNKASGILSGSDHPPSDLAIYLSIDLTKDSSRVIFEEHSDDDYILAGQNALKTILAGDEDSANRLRLCSVSVESWKQLRDKANREDVLRLLQSAGITDQAAVTDFYGIDWWAQAMGNLATAIAKQRSLKAAQQQVLNDSEGGFDIPWALLAMRDLAGSPQVDSKFTVPSSAAAVRSLTATGA